jgi:hypothetical protein
VKGVNRREKGNRLERPVAKLLQAWWGGSFRRSPLSGGWDAERAPGDILTPDDFPWVVECKNREGWDFYGLVGGPEKRGPLEWWDQVERASLDTVRMPMLVMTRRRWPVYCLVNGLTVPILQDAYGVQAVCSLVRATFRKGHGVMGQPDAFALFGLDDLCALDPEPLRLAWRKVVTG